MPFKLTASALFLIVANFIPILGVVYFGWDAIVILVLYWLESIIIGFLNIPKILACRSTEKMSATHIFGNLFTAVFFTAHFGLFTVVHGSMLYELFGAKDIMNSLVSGGPLVWTAASFLFSHIFSMFINFFGRKEYLGRKTNAQMGLPYGRVIVMHIVVLMGGFLVQEFGSPLYALLLLILLKTALDLAAHNKEHQKEDILTS